MKKIGVVLCGSGYKDGTEIREAVATLWALSQAHAEVHCFAPDAEQHDVINCLTGEPLQSEKRNQLVEAARIARGKVKPLSDLKVETLDGLILPGGYGAAKNLCNFAMKGSSGSVNPELKTILETFKEKGKPLGAICIAPAILALAFKGKGFELTVGENSETSMEIEKLGHKHVPCAPDAIVVDKHNRIVTTPAYMFDDAPLHKIFSGIQKLVQEVVTY